MSYSRYSFSRWYTYRSAGASHDADCADDEVFCCDVRDFTYGQLRESIDICLQVVWELCPDVTPVELLELRDYMVEFMCAVEFDWDIRLACGKQSSQKELTLARKCDELGIERLPSLLAFHDAGPFTRELLSKADLDASLDQELTLQRFSTQRARFSKREGKGKR